MATASGTSLGVPLCEVAEAGTWVVYATGRQRHAEPNAPSQNSFPCAMGWFLNIWAADTQCDLAGPWYTAVPNTSCLCPTSQNQFKAVKSVKIAWHHEDRP